MLFTWSSWSSCHISDCSQLLTEKAKIRFHVNPCEIYGKVAARRVPPSTLVCSWKYHRIIASSSDLILTKGQAWEPWRGASRTLIFVMNKNCTRPSSDPPSSLPSSQGISEGGGGGWRQQGRYVKSMLQKITSFIVAYCSRVAKVPPERAHIRSTALILLKDSRGWSFLCLSLIRRCQNSNSGCYHLTSRSKLTG